MLLWRIKIAGARGVKAARADGILLFYHPYACRDFKVTYDRHTIHFEETRSLIESTDAETYAIAASDVLRLYFERRSRNNAVRQTSDEFLTKLADTDLSPIREHRNALREFLTQCALVKFARGELNTEQREAVYESARNFIRITSQLSESPAESEVAVDASFPTNPPHFSS